MALTPNDAARLQRLGIVLLTNLAQLSTFTLLYGVFIMVFSIAVHTTLCHGLKSRPALIIFILIIFSFTMATLHWATWMATVAIQIRLTLVENIGMDLSGRFTLANAATRKLGLIELFFVPFLMIVNDGVVIWRAWVLFPEHQWVVIGPLFFLLVTFVMTITYLVTYCMSIISSNLLDTMSKCTLIISMVTNLLATLLIAYKLWDYRKTISNLGLKKRQSHVQKVLFLLVESGVLLLGLQLASLLFSWLVPGSLGTAAYYVADIWQAIYAEAVAMYPSLILIIVNKGHSSVETIGFSMTFRSRNGQGHTNNAAHRPATIEHLIFADPPTKSTVDNDESLSYPD